MHKKVSIFLSLVFCLLLVFYSCDTDYTPKRRGFFRIDLPEKEYQVFDTTYPYLFEHPVYSRVVPDESIYAEPYWVDLVFPRFDATIHITYKDVAGEANQLHRFAEDARSFTNRQIPKATAINEERVVLPGNSVYGMVYYIEGTEVASTIQFFVTDSVDHFLRGALYFNVTPNNDSLAPVISFLKEDIDHMIKTLRWQKAE